ncbi:SDR family NAD(P)-dependent oxidoreductase [Ancylobacter radicis]|uniref:SDR family oxidoreductase n=1 Tax=Ancylobacter radicis TaxID=2836179 RepID=A0ABS5R997_9HYPH|nr:SDR family oxidoreductase [Ancylobacter radicis]MBS9477830.1 SDR family oxidoreductase [Ancylobacter radicis]
MSHASPGTALVTGASSGIGKVYADRLAKRGYDLILVARNRARLEALAGELAAATGRRIEVLAADLAEPQDAARVAARIVEDPTLTLVVNNAGSGTEGPVVGADAGKIDAMVQLNVVALTRLAVAAVDTFARRGRGTLINIASVVALVPEGFPGAYAATKAYVLAFSQSLQSELQGGPVRVQAVLPGATRTEFFARAGLDENLFPAEAVMSAEDLVDAALAGLDMGEAITIPPLPDAAGYEAVTAARLALQPGLSLQHPALRYAITAKPVV